MKPIQQVPRLLSEPQAKQIHAWLNMPEAKAYREYLIAKGVAHASEAVNFLIDGTPNDKIEGNAKLDAARPFLTTAKMLDDHSVHGYKFEVADLKPATRL